MSDKTVVKGGFPFLSILCLIFIALKLAGVGVVATWSWWAVMSPLWVPIVIVFVLFAIMFGLYLWSAK